MKATMVRFGDLSGKNVVYDDDGRLILGTNETILLLSPEHNIYAECPAPKRKNQRILEPSKEEGLLYITNQRLVFIRKPDAWLAAWRDLTPVLISNAPAKALMAKDLKAMKGCYYLEVPFREIVSFAVRRNRYATIIAVAGTLKVLVEVYRKGRRDSKLAVLQETILKENPLSMREAGAENN